MRNFKNLYPYTFFIIFAALILVCTKKEPETIKSEYREILPDERFSSARKTIQEDMKETGVVSLSICAAQNGKIIWQEAFGWADIENSIKATPFTMYSLASISKPVTATGLMSLVEKGLIDLDSSAEEYIDPLHLIHYEGKADDAAIRLLLSHTSGLPIHYNFYFEDEDYPVPPMEESIRHYGILVNKPGEVFVYSNIGYGILDYIISKVSGSPYADFIQSEVFEPLGMKRSAVITQPDQLSGAAKRYDKQKHPFPFYDFDHRGASSVYSTAHDLVEFGMFHLKQNLPGQKKILNNNTIDLMQQAAASMWSNSLYGLGWMIDEDDHGYKSVGHTGDMHGVATILKLIPSEKIVVSVLCNSNHNIRQKIANNILSVLLPEFGKKRTGPAEQKEPDKKINIPGEYAGNWKGIIKTYERIMQVSMKIQSNGTIDAKIGDQPEQRMTRVRMDKGMLRGRIKSVIKTKDTLRQPHEIDLHLKHRGNRLSGSATARSTAKRGFGLTSWIVLKKNKTKSLTGK